MTTSADEQDKRLDRLELRMDKYDEIINELKEIVISIKASGEATAKTHKAWINGILMVIMVGATVVGGLIGAVATHLIH